MGRVMVEDPLPIPRAVIAELGVRGDGVDVVPEHLQQPLVADPLRALQHLDGFGAAGRVSGHFPLGRVLRAAARVPGGGRDHPVQLVVRGLLHQKHPSAKVASACPLVIVAADTDMVPNTSVTPSLVRTVVPRAPAQAGVNVRLTPLMQ